jgi:hypothetical protein
MCARIAGQSSVLTLVAAFLLSARPVGLFYQGSRLKLKGSSVFIAADTAIDPDIVTPGVVGFLATFFVAIVTVLLIWDMVRRIRRQRYQAEIEAKLDAEQAAATKKK